MGGRWRPWVLIMVMLLLTGCSLMPSSGSHALDPVADARKSLDAYLIGRQNGDLKAAFAALSPKSQRLIGEQQFMAYYGQYSTMRWKEISDGRQVMQDWVRFVVTDVETNGVDGERVQLPDVAYYVQQSGDTWGVAVINPVLGAFAQATSPEDEESVMNQLLEVHPYSSSLHQRQFAQAMRQEDVEKATQAWNRLYMVSTPSELPTLQVNKAEMFMAVGAHADALQSLQRALALAPSYPELFKAPWRSSVLTEMGRAYGQSGDRTNAARLLEEAAALDPENQEAQMLLLNLDSAP